MNRKFENTGWAYDTDELVLHAIEYVTGAELRVGNESSDCESTRTEAEKLYFNGGREHEVLNAINKLVTTPDSDFLTWGDSNFAKLNELTNKYELIVKSHRI